MKNVRNNNKNIAYNNIIVIIMSTRYCNKGLSGGRRADSAISGGYAPDYSAKKADGSSIVDEPAEC